MARCLGALKKLMVQEAKEPEHKSIKNALLSAGETPMPKRTKKKRAKVEKVMHEWKEGKLHSGSKKGPKVKGRKQAIAIAISESKRSKKK